MPITRRDKWLRLSLVAYLILAVLFIANYAKKLPYQLMAAIALANFAVVVFIMRAIRREVISSAALDSSKKQEQGIKRGIRPTLLFGTIVYSAIFIFGIAYGYSQLGKLPVVSIIVAELVNATMLVAVLNSVRKAYLQNRQ
jgi:hypothetical protein